MISANCYYMRKKSSCSDDKEWLEFVCRERKISSLISEKDEKGYVNIILLDTFNRPAYEFAYDTGCCNLRRLDTDTVNKFLILLGLEIDEVNNKKGEKKNDRDNRWCNFRNDSC